jgi:hypothetical protein
MFAALASVLVFDTEVIPMADDPIPRDALFIKFGRFQAGASGPIGILALIAVAMGFMAGRAWGLW